MSTSDEGDDHELQEEVEAQPQPPQSHDELLLRYFEPADDEGFSKCKICVNLLPAHRRGSTGKVVSFHISYTTELLILI